MWIMGLHREFYQAIPIVANMTFSLESVILLFSRYCENIAEIRLYRERMLPSLRQSFVISEGYYLHTRFPESQFCLAARTIWERCSFLR